MLDVKRIRTLGEVQMSVRHPVTGEDTGATFVIAGPEHPKRREQRFALQRKLRERYAAGGKGAAAADPEITAAETIIAIADSILDWNGIGEDGTPILYSPVAARSLLAQPEMAWLSEQVAEFLNDQRNFITPSSGS